MEQLGHEPPDAVVLPSLRERLGEVDQDLLQQVQHGLELLALRLVRALLPETLLRGDERVVDDVEDVGVVGVEELDDVDGLRIVEEKTQMLKIKSCDNIRKCYNNRNPPIDAIRITP